MLAPGNYRILVEKPKYLPFQAAITVMPDTTVEVSATLASELRQTPWYKDGICGPALCLAQVRWRRRQWRSSWPPMLPPDTSHLPGSIVFK